MEPSKKETALETRYVPAQAVTHGSKDHFFGFYDKCPWDSTGRFMLAMEAIFESHLPGPRDVAAIGIVDLNDGNRFERIAETRAWNWHMGAMLQWVPSAPDRLIIYNDREEDHFVSVLLDIKSGERRILPLPVYALSHDGRFALSLNFARLNDERKGYGYAGVTDPWQKDLYPKDDGIYLMDLNTGEYQLVISLAQLATFPPVPRIKSGKHWVMHSMFNPDDTRFCFLHRFQLRNGRYYTRLFTANLDGLEICCLISHGMVSHFDWRNPHQILAWARHQPSLTFITKRSNIFNRSPLRQMLTLYHKLDPTWVRQRVIGDGYFLFTDRTAEVERIGTGVLTTDGHCSYSPDGRWILTDTYPDEERRRALLLYSPEERRGVVIGRFYSPPEVDGPRHALAPYRCDLHPRWNRDGTLVCIDSAHEGHRQMYVLNVRSIVHKAHEREALFEAYTMDRVRAKMEKDRI